MINEVDYNRFDVNYSINNVAGINITTGNYTLGLGYQAAIEPVNLYIYNGTAWNYKTSLNSTAMTMYYTQLTQQQYNNSFVKVRFNDSNWGVDTTTDSFYVSTLYVFSDTNKLYSCEYCHDFNKHFGNALGSPEYYNGMNDLHQSINKSDGTWCASCHYQGYSSGSDSYNDMVSEMLSRGLPVPPEITGNASYAPINVSGYRNHSQFNYYDYICFTCHGGNLSSSAGMAEFMHILTISPSGGKNCIQCHNRVTGLASRVESGINLTAFNQSSHVRMNYANATNQGYPSAVGACWACHSSNGNLTTDLHHDRQKNPKTCTECHLGTGTYNNSAFNAIIVSEHYYGGIDIKADNSSSNISSCINCHENISEMIIFNNDTDTAVDPTFTGDGLRLVGGNMSFYHYGNNRTDIRLGTSVNCTNCHQNTTFGSGARIIPSTLKHSSNLSNGSIWNSTATTYWTSQNGACYYCHNNTKHNSTALGRMNSLLSNCNTCHALNGTGTYLATSRNYSHSLDPGTGGGEPNCITCHNLVTGISGGATTGINFTAANASSHNGTNSNNATQRGFAPVVGACWACHDSDFNAIIVSEHFYGGSEIRSGNSSSNMTSCINCHENVSTAFSPIMVNSSYNNSISNHSTGYNSTNPSCISTQCHGSGWIHNSSLSKPSISIPNSSYCLSCHGNNGSGSTNYTGSVTGIKEKHNNSLDCSECHLNTSKSIHPVWYLQQDGSNWSTSNSSAVNCTNCHTKGHRNIGARKACEDCHAVQADPINDKDRHNITSTPSSYFYNSVNVVNITTCTTCHSGTLYNTSIATYGYWKQKDCDYCHTYPDKYYG